MVQGVDVLVHEVGAQGPRTLVWDEAAIGDLWECLAHWPQVLEQGTLRHHIQGDQGTDHEGRRRDKWTWGYLLTSWLPRLSSAPEVEAVVHHHSQSARIQGPAATADPNGEVDCRSKPHGDT